MPEEQGNMASSCVGELVCFSEKQVSKMSGTGGCESICAGVERHRGLVAITAGERRPPRLEGAVPLLPSRLKHF